MRGNKANSFGGRSWNLVVCRIFERDFGYVRYCIVVVRGESPTKIHKNESMVNLRKTEFVARISLRNSVNKTRADKSYKRSLTWLTHSPKKNDSSMKNRIEIIGEQSIILIVNEFPSNHLADGWIILYFAWISGGALDAWGTRHNHTSLMANESPSNHLGWWIISCFAWISGALIA